MKQITRSRAWLGAVVFMSLIGLFPAEASSPCMEDAGAVCAQGRWGQPSGWGGCPFPPVSECDAFSF
jgi:hypothetical protein